MSKDHDPPAAPSGPDFTDHAVSALNAWIGDDLAAQGNPLHRPMAFTQGNRAVAPAALPRAERVAVWIHGLGCNESMWQLPPSEQALPFGETLYAELGYVPLYLRYNTGQGISTNGAHLNALLQDYVDHHPEAVEILLVGHSMGGLVIRSACHLARPAGWTQRVQHIFYLGSPHLGAPLERVADVASQLLSALPSTATQVIGDVLNTRSEGVKDLRYGTLSGQRRGAADPALNPEHEAIPWLPEVHHHRVVGEVVEGLGGLGDAVVPSWSAAGAGSAHQPGAGDLQVLPGLHHLALAQHPRAYAALRGRLSGAPPEAATDVRPATDSDPTQTASQQRRWDGAKGIAALIHRSVDRTTNLVERHHRRAARVPFRALEQVAPLAGAAKTVEAIHDAVLGVSYGSVQAVNKVVEEVDRRILEELSTRETE